MIANNEALTPAERRCVDQAMRNWWNTHADDPFVDMVTRVKALNTIAARTVHELRGEKRDQFGWDRER